MSNILFVGAHTDDIELGAGGVLNSLLKSHQHKIYYQTFSRCLDLPRNKDILKDQLQISLYLDSYGCSIRMQDLPNKALSNHAEEIRSILELYDVDIIFTHWKDDIHQDHKSVTDEVLRVFRNKTIIEYECIRSCPSFTPNFYVTIDEQSLQDKINLLNLYKSQDVYYMKEPIIRAQAMVRGAEVNKSQAEGFFLRRFIGDTNLCVLSQ